MLPRAPLPSLSVVLPCLDEEASVARVVAQVSAVAERVAQRWEVLVVDDGSRDRTAAIVQDIDDPRVRLLQHERNRGYGAALRTGFAAARHDWIFFLDADGQYEPEELARHASEVSDTTMLIGYRAERRDALHRVWNGRLWTWLVNLTLGLGVRDVDCAFKLFPRALVVDPPLRAEGASVDAELLLAGRRRRLQIVEVPVSHRPRQAGIATGARPQVVLRALLELAELLRSTRTRLSGV